MRARKPPRPPPIVEKKRSKKSAGAPAEPRPSLPPDRGRIQAIRDGDPDHIKQKERIGRQSSTDRWEAGWEEANATMEARLRQANDPDVVRDAARVSVGHALIDAAMSNFVVVEGDLPHLRIYAHRDPRREHWTLLKQAWAKLHPNTKSAVSDARGSGPPARGWSWAAFMRDLRGKKD